MEGIPRRTITTQIYRADVDGNVKKCQPRHTHLDQIKMSLKMARLNRKCLKYWYEWRKQKKHIYVTSIADGDGCSLIMTCRFKCSLGYGGEWIRLSMSKSLSLCGTVADFVRYIKPITCGKGQAMSRVPIHNANRVTTSIQNQATRLIAGPQPIGMEQVKKK